MDDRNSDGTHLVGNAISYKKISPHRVVATVSITITYFLFILRRHMQLKHISVLLDCSLDEHTLPTLQTVEGRHSPTRSHSHLGEISLLGPFPLILLDWVPEEY